MSFKTFLAIGSAFIATAALAQASLGSINSVEGIVTVTDGAKLGTAAAGGPITDGTRFVATSTGRAVLRLNNGCVVNLGPGQAVTVLKSMTCDQLLAAVDTPRLVAAAGGATRGALATGGLFAGSLVVLNSLSRH